MTTVIHHSHMFRVMSCHMMKSHEECKRIVHKQYSSCISSIQNLTETLLSSFCQLGLEV